MTTEEKIEAILMPIRTKHSDIAKVDLAKQLIVNWHEDEMQKQRASLMEMGWSKFVRTVLLGYGKMQISTDFADDTYLIRVPRKVMEEYENGNLKGLVR